MQEKLENLEKRFIELEQQLADIKVINDQALYLKLAKELSEISPIVYKFRELREAEKQQEELKKLMSEPHDKAFLELANSELSLLDEKKKNLKQYFKNSTVESCTFFCLAAGWESVH